MQESMVGSRLVLVCRHTEKTNMELLKALMLEY